MKYTARASLAAKMARALPLPCFFFSRSCRAWAGALPRRNVVASSQKAHFRWALPILPPACPRSLPADSRAGLDLPAVGHEVLHPREALDGADLVQDHQGQDQIGPVDRAQQREGLAVVLLGARADMPLELGQQRVVLIDHGQIQGDGVAHLGIGEMGQQPLALAALADALLEGGQVVLADGVLDMGDELRALVDQVAAPPQQIAGGAHLGRIDIGQRQHPASQQPAILWASILSFLALPPWMAPMYSACPSTKAIPSRAHRSATQYQANMHSTATTRSSLKGFTAARNACGVHSRLREKHTLPAASMMHTYI